ncbi:MAG: type IV secretion protein IcmC [Gammaproteobacteria bacterium]|nr:type IV secretion protein IcmC [Gammaproteobacteria bacterium]MCH9763439.1 type IV secretion protein IcmC [Gammaproteobacteria bacterium]
MSNSTSMLINLADSLIPVQKLISGAAYLVGVSFAFKAIYSLKIYGEAKTMQSSSTSAKEPIFYLLVSGFLIYFPSALDVIMNSTFGNSSILAYGDSDIVSSGFGGDSEAGMAIVSIFQTIGLYAFVRGWVLIARSASQGQQPGGMGKGLMHVFGGILAVNIVGTVEIINNTLLGT